MCIETLQPFFHMSSLEPYTMEVVLQCMLDNMADRVSTVACRVALTPWWPINWQLPLSKTPEGSQSLEAVMTRWNCDLLIKEWVQKEMVCVIQLDIMAELMLCPIGNSHPHSGHRAYKRV